MFSLYKSLASSLTYRKLQGSNPNLNSKNFLIILTATFPPRFAGTFQITHLSLTVSAEHAHFSLPPFCNDEISLGIFALSRRLFIHAFSEESETQFPTVGNPQGRVLPVWELAFIRHAQSSVCRWRARERRERANPELRFSPRRFLIHFPDATLEKRTRRKMFSHHKNGNFLLI